MRELFTTKERAQQLRDKGFAEVCLAYTYPDGNTFHISQKGVSEIGPSGEIPLPLYQQVLDWLREAESIIINITREPYWEYSLNTPGAIERSRTDYESYYEALNAAIEEALKLI